MLTAAPFVIGVTNPLPVRGGDDLEQQLQTVQRGPAAIRARGRSVTRADYSVMARFAPGANVDRAHAIPGYHPKYGAATVAGVVGVLVLSKNGDSERPIPDEQTLQSVSNYLSNQVAPVGVEVVSAVPKFREIQIQAQFISNHSSDRGKLQRQIDSRITNYLHPLYGGRNREGWPFGETLVYGDLVNVLMTEDISSDYQPPKSISLRLVVDGTPLTRCQNVALAKDELFWPIDHQIFPAEQGASS